MGNVRRYLSIVLLALLPFGAVTFKTSVADETKTLKGSMFVTIANANTFRGTLKNGVSFQAYFLQGGLATYMDEKGNHDSGTWRVRQDDAVCVQWKTMDPDTERCAIVRLDGSKLVLEGNTRVGEVEILGTIAPNFGQ